MKLKFSDFDKSFSNGYVALVASWCEEESGEIVVDDFFGGTLEGKVSFCGGGVGMDVFYGSNYKLVGVSDVSFFFGDFV